MCNLRKTNLICGVPSSSSILHLRPTLKIDAHKASHAIPIIAEGHAQEDAKEFQGIGHAHRSLAAVVQFVVQKGLATPVQRPDRCDC